MIMKDFLKNVLIFSNLTDAQYNAIVDIAIVKKFSKKEIVFHDSDKANGFYVVVTGKVKIFKTSFDGKEQILHIFGAHQIFGEVPVFSGKVFPASAMAIENSTILFLPKDKFIDLVEKNPKIALNMLSILSLRLHAFTNVIETLSLKEIPSRLASYLLFLYKKKKNPRFTLDVSKNQLASILGTIPETLSRIFNKLSQNDFLEINGKNIYIKDLNKLTDLAEGIEKI